MTDAGAAGMIVLGTVATLGLIFSKDFYAAGIGGVKGREKAKVPKWWGRLWFFGFSTIMFYLGIHHFIGKH